MLRFIFKLINFYYKVKSFTDQKILCNLVLKYAKLYSCFFYDLCFKMSISQKTKWKWIQKPNKNQPNKISTTSMLKKLKNIKDEIIILNLHLM